MNNGYGVQTFCRTGSQSPVEKVLQSKPTARDCDSSTVQPRMDNRQGRAGGRYQSAGNVPPTNNQRPNVTLEESHDEPVTRPDQPRPNRLPITTVGMTPNQFHRIFY